MHLAVGNQWGLIGMPMAQVKTIKQEEKCLTTPHPNAYTEAEERKREQREGGKKRGLKKYDGFREGDNAECGYGAAELNAVTLSTAQEVASDRSSSP